MHRLLYLASSGLPGEENAAKLPKTSYAGCLPLCQCEDKKKIRSLEKKLVQHMALSHSSQMMAVVLVNLFWGSVSSRCAAAES